MRNLICLILFISSVHLCHSQSYTWAVADGGSIWDDVKAMHLGSDNNLLVTGMFSTTATFDQVTLTSMAFQDVFVAKYTVQGTVLWAKAISGMDQEWGYDITTDQNNNVYVTGYFQSPVLYFTPSDSIVRSSPSMRNVFVAKYNSSGVFQWARSGHGGNTSMFGTSHSVTTDYQNNVIIAGSYNQQITFGSNVLPASAGTSIFMVKYTESGNIMWAKAGASNSMCWINDMITDGNNNIYATGKISTAIMFGTSTVTNIGGDDAITGKFDPAGNLIWMQLEGKSQLASTTANNFDCGNAIALDAYGNVFTGGSQLDTTYYDASISALVTLQSAFVVKYNNSGSRQWIKKFGSDEKDVINGIATDVNGEVYVHGTYRNSMNVGGVTLAAISNTGAFIAKLKNSTGNTEFAYRHGISSSNLTGIGIAIDKTDGDIYTAGNFQSMSSFGPYNLFAAGAWDIFLTGIDNPVIPSSVYETKDELFSIYPNPVTDKLYISLPAFAPDIHRIQITTIYGQVISETEYTGNVLDVSELAPGYYFLSAKMAGNNIYQKFCKVSCIN